FKRAIELNQNHWFAHNNLGKVLIERGKLDDAEAEFKTADRLWPKSATVHLNLGVVFQKKRQADKAEAEYRLAIRLQPEYGLAHFSLGRLLYQQDKNPEEVEQEMRTSLRLDPANVDIRKALVTVLVKHGKRIEAEAVRRPENSIAQYNLGNELRRLGKLNEAA